MKERKNTLFLWLGHKHHIRGGAQNPKARSAFKEKKDERIDWQNSYNEYDHVGFVFRVFLNSFRTTERKSEKRQKKKNELEVGKMEDHIVVGAQPA